MKINKNFNDQKTRKEFLDLPFDAQVVLAAICLMTKKGNISVSEIQIQKYLQSNAKDVILFIDNIKNQVS